MVVGSFKIIIGDDPKLVEYIAYNIQPNGLNRIKPVYIDDPIQSRQLFISKSFLNTNEKKCYISKNLDALQNAETYWDDLLSGKFCNGNTLLLVVDKLDSRTKFAKKFKNAILAIDTAKLDLNQIEPRLADLKKSQVTELFKNCNSNVTQTLLEFNKITCYAAAQNIRVSQAYDILKNSNDLPQITDDNIFDFIDDIVYKKTETVYKKLYLLNKTEFDFGLLVNLYNTFRNLYIYEECLARGALETSGLSVFNIKTVSKFHNLYKRQQLLSIMSFLQKMDTKIKQGTISSEYALDYMSAGVLNS